MKRIPTGIKGIDEILKGGIPESSAILVIGPPGSGKTTFCQQMIFNSLKRDSDAIYIVLDTSPKEAIENMENFGWNVNKYKKNLKFIDGYSWRTGKKGGENAIENIGNINEINIKISKILEKIKENSVEVFDSVSTLLLYCDPSLVVKLIPILIAKGKEAKIIQVFILEEGVHDPKTVTTLNYLTDGLIEFKMEEDKRFLRIVKMAKTSHTRDWIEFEITDNGIEIKKKE